jgi:hypothetical protein
LAVFENFKINHGSLDMLVRFPRNYYMLRFNKARPRYALFSERKRVKKSKIRKLTRKFTKPPFWPFLKILKYTMEVVDMLVRFPRNYYMLGFNKARLLYALISE